MGFCIDVDIFFGIPIQVDTFIKLYQKYMNEDLTMEQLHQEKYDNKKFSELFFKQVEADHPEFKKEIEECFAHKESYCDYIFRIFVDTREIETCNGDENDEKFYQVLFDARRIHNHDRWGYDQTGSTFSFVENDQLAKWKTYFEDKNRIAFYHCLFREYFDVPEEQVKNLVIPQMFLDVSGG